MSIKVEAPSLSALTVALSESKWDPTTQDVEVLRAIMTARMMRIVEFLVKNNMVKDANDATMSAYATAMALGYMDHHLALPPERIEQAMTAGAEECEYGMTKATETRKDAS